MSQVTPSYRSDKYDLPIADVITETFAVQDDQNVSVRLMITIQK